MQTDYIEKIEGSERRFAAKNLEYRKDGEEEFFEGYAAVFGDVADLGWFTETIQPGAFDEVLKDDVRGLFNHDDDQLLGRTKSGTMTLSVDPVGLKYRIKYNPEDPDHVRVMQKVKRGDIAESSFAFLIKDDKWETKNGKDHRTITRFKRLIDVAPVTYPAYPNTSVAARSKESIEKPDHKKDLAEMDLDTMKRDLKIK